MRHESRERHAGFALIELLLAVTLFGIVASFLIVVYQRVSDQLLLTSSGYDVALSFRETQSYGVSVKQGISGSFDAGYGLHFDKGSTATFVRFVDAPAGGSGTPFFYDGQDTTIGCVSGECLSVLRLERGNTIQKFCGVLTDDGGRDAPPAAKHEECSTASTPPSAPPPTIAFLDVVFRRPNPDAVIRTDRSSQVLYKAARVYLLSPKGDTRVIEVVTTGQISVK